MSIFRNLLMALTGGWTGKPASWPDIRKNAPDNCVRLLVDDRYPIGFIATVTGGYSVNIDGEHYNDYNSEAQFSIADWSQYSATDGYAISYPTGASKAHIVDIYPQTTGNNITNCRCSRVAASGNEQQGLLWAHFNLSNQIALTYFANDSASYIEQSLTAITAKGNKLSTQSLYYAFTNTALEYVPDFIFASSMGYLLDGAFSNTKLVNITIKDTAFTDLNEVFYNCQDIEKLDFKNVNFSGLTSARTMITNAVKLKDTSFDFSSATGLTKLGAYGDLTHFIGGLKGLRVSSSAPFSGGEPQINVSYTGLNHTALVQLFNDLPTVSGGQIIHIEGTTGSEDLTAEEKQIATDKGWTVTGGPEFTTYHAYTSANDDTIYTTDNPIIPKEWALQNATVEGILSKSGSIYSGFSRGNYIVLSAINPTTSLDLRIKCNPATSYGDLLRSQPDGKGILLRCSSGSCVAYISTSGSGWDAAQNFNTGIVMSDNADIYVRITWDNMSNTIKFWQSSNGEDWTPREGFESYFPPYLSGGTQTLGGCTEYSEAWGGSIDLDGSGAVIDGTPVNFGYWTTPSIIYEKSGNSLIALDPQPTFTYVSAGLHYAEKIGNPTISDGVFSNFSNSNYVLSELVTLGSNWNIITKFKANSVDSTQFILGREFYFDLYLKNNILQADCGDGTYWTTVEQAGTTQISANIEYFVKYERAGNTYNIYLSTTDTFGATPEITFAAADFGALQIPFGRMVAYNTTLNTFNGSIDFVATAINSNILYNLLPDIVVGATSYERNSAGDIVA